VVQNDEVKRKQIFMKQFYQLTDTSQEKIPDEVSGSWAKEELNMKLYHVILKLSVLEEICKKQELEMPHWYQEILEHIFILMNPEIEQDQERKEGETDQEEEKVNSTNLEQKVELNKVGVVGKEDIPDLTSNLYEEQTEICVNPQGSTDQKFSKDVENRLCTFPLLINGS
jgi:hypothetical protein